MKFEVCQTRHVCHFNKRRVEDLPNGAAGGLFETSVPIFTDQALC